MHKANNSSNEHQPFTNSQSSTTSACSSTASTSYSHSLNFTQIDTAAWNSFPPLSFVICDSPDDARMAEYVAKFKEKGVTDVVRVCKPRYDAQVLRDAGIEVHEFYFEDGGVPGAELLSAWLHLVKECIFSQPTSSTSLNGLSQGDANAEKNCLLEQAQKLHPQKGNSSEVASTFTQPLITTSPVSPAAPPLSQPVIAVHCVAGLGRAPLLVAIALMEFGGLSALDAIELIRSKRRGSLNSRQIRYLVDDYALAASGHNHFVNTSGNRSAGQGDGKSGFFRQLLSRLF
jgi:hypothetical protein